MPSLIATVAIGAIPARADEPPPITIVTPGERSAQNIAIGASLAGAGVIAGAVGLYFHLDSRSASDDVAADGPTSKLWTQAQVDLVDRADSARTKAIVGYSIGGALLVGAIVYWIATDPPSETVVIHPARPAITPVIAPTQGGVTLGGMWSF